MLKRVSDALKDAGSLVIVNLTPRSTYRNPEIEAVVIKVTSHNNSHIDYRSAQRIFAWIHVSGHYVGPVLSALSTRMERTHSWTVALKGLMLLHGIMSCKSPTVQKIGHLPFDLSRTERSLRKGIKENPKKSSMMQDLVWLENLQGLLDMLLEIKPQREKMMNVLVLEAMDCIVIEIFDIYSRICNGIAAVLVRVYSIGKPKARMAFSILQKAAVQANHLSLYIHFCRDFGVAKASESPKIVHINEHDIRALDQVINRDSGQRKPREDNNIMKTDSLRV
ncbi:hypothetical protein L1987_16136 [Smallanthus sonchifolius]|uniref:Uncharacterized protein n=1 Tax=Smallanthus sonchifolius TaxID=185202 RepID=A0ACB9J9S1_9ASTR|nr:hypothetical protein L1987_16136 [Smallanthus sonchifolius]